MTDPIVSIGTRIRTQVLDPLKAAFVGKDEIVDLMGISLVAGENLFLLGPPGTAKSALVRELGRRLRGRTFEYLLTRFTEPSELFGPFDIRKLREGELITNTDGMIPEADLIFLDELLNANSAILNSLLTVLNERSFRRGKETRALPVMMVVGASNHLPEDETLGALFDRFLLRVGCHNVPVEDLGAVLDAGWKLDAPRGDEEGSVAVEEVRRLHGEVFAVDRGPVRKAMVDLVGRLRDSGITITDRRAVKMQRLVAASALLSSRTVTRISDLWVFKYIWDTPEQESVLAEVVDEILRQETPDPADHPRALRLDAPDPETLARDLDAILTEARGRNLDIARVSILKDRLGLISERAQWVRDPDPRDQLQARIDEGFNLLDPAPGPPGGRGRT